MFRVNNVKQNNTINIKPNFSSFLDGELSKKKKQEDEIGLIENLKKWATNPEKKHMQTSKWHKSKMPIKYYIPSNIDLNDAIEAFNMWQRGSAASVRFERINHPLNADIIVETTPNALKSMPFEVGHNDLKLKGNYIEKAIITLVTEPLFDKKLNNIEKKERIKRTLVHEIGHALGLKHSNSSKDVMFHQGINNKFLTKNDIRRIGDLYNSQRPDFII